MQSMILRITPNPKKFLKEVASNGTVIKVIARIKSKLINVLHSGESGLRIG
jgi:hypothetical protein